MASSKFLSCHLKPVPDGESSITILSDAKVKVSSFYLDTTGRSSISLPLRLQFPSAEMLQEFRELTRFEIACSSDPDNLESKDSVEVGSEPSRFSLSIEAKVTLTFGSGEAVSATVEGVSVISYKIDGDSIYFDTAILMLVSRKGEPGMPSNTTFVKTNVEVTALMLEKKKRSEISPYSVLDGINLGEFRSVEKDTSRSLVQRTRLSPITLLVALTHAFSITTRSISGGVAGRTLVAINMCHSNTHNEKVVISNITLHPGNSQQLHPATQSAYDDDLYDMSNNVRWSFVKECSVDLPLILKPHDVVSTVIAIEATVDEVYRTFRCPVSVSGTVGSKDRLLRNFKSIAASEIEWTTSQAASDASEAFRVDMKLHSASIQLGSAFAVTLNIANISGQKRDIRLELLPDSAQPAARNTNSSQLSQAVTENALIPIDSTLSIGELSGKARTEVTMRFIATKSGTLRLPSFALVDCKSCKEYHCLHDMRVVVQPL
jgi:hypothetical protein